MRHSIVVDACECFYAVHEPINSKYAAIASHWQSYSRPPKSLHSWAIANWKLGVAKPKKLLRWKTREIHTLTAQIGKFRAANNNAVNIAALTNQMWFGSRSRRPECTKTHRPINVAKSTKWCATAKIGTSKEPPNWKRCGSETSASPNWLCTRVSVSFHLY